MRQRLLVLTVTLALATLAASAWDGVGEVIGIPAEPMRQQARPPSKAPAGKAPAGTAAGATAPAFCRIRELVKSVYDGSGAPDIPMRLYGVTPGGNVLSDPAQLVNTDGAGIYSFGVPCDQVGTTFQVKAGLFVGEIPFLPNNMRVVLVRGTTTMDDILYTPPQIKMAVRAETPDGVGMAGIDMRLTRVIAPGEGIVGYNHATTNEDGYCWFWISWSWAGHDFVVRPSSTPFNPVSQRFTLEIEAYPPPNRFTYAGPLPDLVVSPVTEGPLSGIAEVGGAFRKVTLLVRNAGNATAGASRLDFMYTVVDSQQRPQGDAQSAEHCETGTTPSLAPGASHTALEVSAPYSDRFIKVRGWRVDPHNVVGESNGTNNWLGQTPPAGCQW